MKEREIIKFYLDQGILLSPDLLEYIKDRPFPVKTNFTVLNKESLVITEHKIPINVDDFEKAIVLREKHKDGRLYGKFQEYILQHIRPEEKKPETNKPEETAQATPEIIPEEKELTELNIHEYKEKLMRDHRIKILFDYKEKSHKRTVNDFVNYFNARFKELEKILRQRQELSSLTSIARINQKKERENVALIGLVYDKIVSKNNNILLTLEDQTGTVKVLVNHNKEDLFALAQEVQLDEIIGVTGTFDKLVFANNIILPDIPLTKELKKSPEPGYFVVIADPQIGNKLFLEKEFTKLIEWINGEQGNEQQKEIASKIKYIFIVGDLVDGVGIYPDQEYDLNIIDIKDQYAALAEHLKKIKSIPIIVCPGNHDVGRMSEPQPAFNDEYSRPIWMLPNVICVSNPSLINIFSSKDFEGFDVQLYHGGSFIYYSYALPDVRQRGGQKRADLIMRYQLQRRHLSPTHTATLYIPDSRKDPLVIDKVPDFLFSGHIHRASVNNYRNITCINASCWVAKSAEQERRGLEPQPGRAFIIDMQTREIKIMNFLKENG